MSRHQFLLILVLVGGMIALASGNKSASPRCRLYQIERKLECRGRGLRKIPEVANGVLIADFADNSITRVSQEDLKRLEKLEKVYLKGNRFHCDCNLEHLRLKIVRNSDSPFIQDGENLQCFTPMQYRNKALNSLSELCDITAENEHSKPSFRIQKRNANASVDGCGDSKKCSGSNAECPEGYQRNDDGECNDDIDECKTGAHTCNKTNSQCENLEGSHRCKCLPGFTQIQDKLCDDIDECKSSSFCGDENATCTNTIGSYECICKKKGYEYDRANKSCVDIDECDKGPGCGENAICKDYDGGFTCLCQPGQRKEGNDCKDIDVCAESAPCKGAHRKCVPTKEEPSGYKCECEDGFLPDTMIQQNCKDEDECKTKSYKCAKRNYCRNTYGSHICECPKGYEGNASIKCSLSRWTRFTTPKHLLNDLKKGAWDTILVVIGAGAVAMVIVFLILRKMCRKCCSQDDMYYTEEMYDPNHMFFTEGEQMYYPDEMAYYPGQEEYYPEGTHEMHDPNEMHYDAVNPNEMHYEAVNPNEMHYAAVNPNEMHYDAVNPNEMHYDDVNLDEMYYGDVGGPLPLQKSASLQHTYYYDYPDDEVSDDNA